VGNLTIKPVDPDDPPAGLVPYEPVRGIVIYWRSTSPQPAKRRRHQSFQLPLPDWQAHQVGFHEVSDDDTDEPPRDVTEQERFV
jgi:hypothetical protein